MKKIALLLLLIAFFNVSVGHVRAQNRNTGVREGIERGGNNGGSTGITNPAIGELGDDPQAAASGSTFQRYFITLWQALITVGALMVLIYFLWGGIEWISAGGDSGKIQKARDKITQAIIGLIVLVGSFAIITWVSRIFFGDDFNILRLQFGGTTQSQQMQNAQDAAQRAVDGINVPSLF